MTRATQAQIEAAAAAAADAYGAEQVILFGSQARGDARPGSDIDLLVLTRGAETPPDPGRAAVERVAADSPIAAAAGGRSVHLVLMTTSDAEAARCYPAKVGGTAVEEGVTVYADPAGAVIETGPRYWIMPGGAMVKKTRFDVGESERFRLNALDYLKYGTVDPGQRPEMRCVQLQKAIEHALKGFLTASGAKVPHTHDLNELWDAVEAAGVEIETPREEAALARLTKYAGELEYGEPPPDESPGKTLAAVLPTAVDVVKQAERRMPAIAEATAERLRELERTAVGTTEPTPGPRLSAPPETTGGPTQAAPPTRGDGLPAGGTARPRPSRRGPTRSGRG